MTHILINPELLTWARQRAGLDTFALIGCSCALKVSA